MRFSIRISLGIAIATGVLSTTVTSQSQASRPSPAPITEGRLTDPAPDLPRGANLPPNWLADDQFGEQHKVLGASLDWSRERFTLDEGVSRAVVEVFVRLHEEGLIYRAQRLINWDPQLQTAVSDLEVENEEKNGTLWHIAYPVKGSDEKLTVATTRPETMLGDTAVAVHPDDPRFKHLVGKHVVLPLTADTRGW